MNIACSAFTNCKTYFEQAIKMKFAITTSYLWNGGPLRELLDALSEIWVGQNVSAAKVDACIRQQLLKLLGAFL